MDGPALQKRLGELGSTLPIIFLTAYHDIPATVQAIKAGADDFLTKPVTSDDLFRRLKRLSLTTKHYAIWRTNWTACTPVSGD